MAASEQTLTCRDTEHLALYPGQYCHFDKIVAYPQKELDIITGYVYCVLHVKGSNWVQETRVTSTAWLQAWRYHQVPLDK